MKKINYETRLKELELKHKKDAAMYQRDKKYLKELKQYSRELKPALRRVPEESVA